MSQTQRRERGATVGIAAQARALRRAREWSAEQLADAMRAEGIGWDRAIVAAVENGRRRSISVDEVLALAKVLDVAPVHLIVPIDAEEYAITPTATVPAETARAWIAGETPVNGGYWWHRHRPFRTGGASARAMAGGTKQVTKRGKR